MTSDPSFNQYSTVIVSSFLFLCATIVLLEIRIDQKRIRQPLRIFLALYTLPMVAVWGIYLLTFFPGMMSPDSNVQWGQILSGQFNDAHPVFHTLSMWLVTQGLVIPGRGRDLPDPFPEPDCRLGDPPA